MCLIVCALEQHPRYRLIVAANRDEFHHRLSRPAAFWDHAPHVLAGRDESAGGTWLGVTVQGRFAAVTNYRDPRRPLIDGTSRGTLVSSFLEGDASPEDYLSDISRRGHEYNGFNLLVADRAGMWYYSNCGGTLQRVTTGFHGLSNHLLDTPWPKVTAAVSGLEQVVRQQEPGCDLLFEVLTDSRPFPDQLLPETGVGLERERQLSSLFISGSHYGTRSSTVVMVGYDGGVEFCERSFDAKMHCTGEVRHILPGRRSGGGQ